MDGGNIHVNTSDLISRASTLEWVYLLNAYSAVKKSTQKARSKKHDCNALRDINSAFAIPCFRITYNLRVLLSAFQHITRFVPKCCAVLPLAFDVLERRFEAPSKGK